MHRNQAGLYTFPLCHMPRWALGILSGRFWPLGYPWPHSSAIWKWTSPVRTQNPKLARMHSNSALLKVGVRRGACDPTEGWASCLAPGNMTVMDFSTCFSSTISDQAEMRHSGAAGSPVSSLGDRGGRGQLGFCLLPPPSHALLSATKHL